MCGVREVETELKNNKRYTRILSVRFFNHSTREQKVAQSIFIFFNVLYRIYFLIRENEIHKTLELSVDFHMFVGF